MSKPEFANDVGGRGRRTPGWEMKKDPVVIFFLGKKAYRRQRERERERDGIHCG